MVYTTYIQKAINYIEANLRFGVTVEACAEVAGYSVYHFLRIFKRTTGLTPASYIRKRKLAEAVKTIIETDDPIYKIALDFGFNSSENFIRAFKDEHNMTPVKYKTVFSCLHLLEKIELEIEESEVEKINIVPQIVKLDKFILYGYRLKTSFEKSHYEVPKFWNRYHSEERGRQLKPNIDSCSRLDFGVSILDFENDTFDYFIGVKNDKPISEVESLEIDGGLYAVFKTPKADSFTFVETVHKTWEYIIHSYFPSCDKYIMRNADSFESYCEGSYSYSQEIYIPIKYL